MTIFKVAIIAAGLLNYTFVASAQDFPAETPFENSLESRDLVDSTDLDRASSELTCVLAPKMGSTMVGNPVQYELMALSATPLSSVSIDGATTTLDPNTLLLVKNFSVVPSKAGPYKASVYVSNGRSRVSCRVAPVNIAPKPICKPGQTPILESKVRSFVAHVVFAEQRTANETELRCIAH
jgi:hypothetical protein